jgi:hypothetical protein
MAGFFKPKSEWRDGREILLRLPIGHHHQMPVFDAAFGDEGIGNQSGNSSREYPADFGGLIDYALTAAEICTGRNFLWWSNVAIRERMQHVER